jgi:Ca2+-binding RTX toxin-like protein
MPSASVVGGIQWALDTTQISLAQTLLDNFAGSTPVNVMTNPTDTPIPGDFNVYNIAGGGAFTLPTNAQAVVLTPANTMPTTLTGNGGVDFLSGNMGNDNINMAGGGGTIFSGDGNSVVNLSGGTDPFVDLGAGVDTVNMTGGVATISNVNPPTGVSAVDISAGANTVVANTPLDVNVLGTSSNVITMNDGGAVKLYAGSNTVNLGSGSDTVASYGGTNSVNITGSGSYTMYGGNDTITMGSGNDTVVASGAATVIGTNGTYNVTGLMGNDSMVSGSGSATMSGVFGNDTFSGGSGTDSFIGGSGNDLFQYNETSAGGTHVISNFVSGQDQLQLTGYDTTTVLAHDVSTSGGNTTITLDSGATTITLQNFTGLNASNFHP